MLDNQNQFWWRDEFFEDYEGDERKNLVTPTKERAAWIYELVRALAANFPDLLPRVAALVPFPQLREVDRHGLELLIESLPYMRPLSRPGARSASPSKTKYSEPFPSMSFDLTADNAPLLEIFRNWLNWQRTKHGCERPTGKKKAQKSHNRRRKEPNWRWVELLNHRPGENPEPLTERQRTMRHEARVFALKHANLVLSRLAGVDKQLTNELESMRVFLKGVFPELEGLQLSEKLVGEIAEQLVKTLASGDVDPSETLRSIANSYMTKNLPPAAT